MADIWQVLLAVCHYSVIAVIEEKIIVPFYIS